MHARAGKCRVSHVSQLKRQRLGSGVRLNPGDAWNTDGQVFDTDGRSGRVQASKWRTADGGKRGVKRSVPPVAIAMPGPGGPHNVANLMRRRRA